MDTLRLPESKLRATCEPAGFVLRPNPARRITHSLGEYMSLFDPQRNGGSPSGVPLWPAILSLLGPVVLISAIVKNDGLAVYVAGVIVTILGWSQLIPWLRHR